MIAIRPDIAAIIQRMLAGRSLGSLMGDREDNILLLRLVAALLVVWGHSYVIVGRGVEELEPIRRLVGRSYANILGVVIFFVLSGFLVSSSWDRRPEFGRFLRARALRIFPALVVCVAITAFVIGTFVTHDPHYWSSKAVYHYVFGGVSLLDVQMLLPGVFEHAPATPIVNGSLWTLPIEATLYIVVAVAGVAGAFRHRILAALAIAAAAAITIVWPVLSGTQGWLGWSMVGFFCLGACAYLIRDHLPISGGLVVVLILAWVVSRGTRLEVPLFWCMIPYAAFWFAYIPRFPDVLRNHDLSYGIYLWAFPIQQLIVAAGIRDPLVLFAWALPITSGIASLSWLLVERRALTFKDPHPSPKDLDSRHERQASALAYAKLESDPLSPGIFDSKSNESEARLNREN